MPRKPNRNPAKQPAPTEPPKRAGAEYPVGEADLKAQDARLKKAAAAGAGALKTAALPGEPAARPADKGEKAQAPDTGGKIEVVFVLNEPHAKDVSLRGDFNAWLADAAIMKRHADGCWRIAVMLAPGRYEYKFFVDGQWVPDPQAKEQVWNQHGTLNSVIQVRL